MSTKKEIKDLLAELRDDHYEAKENAVGDRQKRYHEVASSELQRAIILIEDKIEEE